MKKHNAIFSLSVIAFVGLIMCGCSDHVETIKGNGFPKKEIRTVQTFDKITADGAYTIKINCQAEQNLGVECDSNLLQYVKTDIEENTLHIHTSKNISPKHRVALTISMTNLSRATINGSSSLDVDKVSNDTLDFIINGSGKLLCKGKTVHLGLSLNGSSEVDTKSLAAENVHIEIAGEGKAKVSVNQSLDALIAGSGRIEYFGNPSIVKQNVSGAGIIVKR